MSAVTEAAVRARLAADSAAQHMGIEIVTVQEHVVTLRLPLQDWMINGHGVLHGAAMFWLGDTAFAFLSESRGHPSVTRQADITFITPLATGDDLYAVATEKARFGRNSIVDVDLRDGDDVLVGTMTVHGSALPPSET